MNLYEKLKDQKKFNDYHKKHGVLMNEIKSDLQKNTSYVDLKYSTVYRLFRIFELKDLRPLTIAQLFKN